jgi:hypothetical protein
VGAWLGCPIAPLKGWEKCGGGRATDRNCGPKKAFAGAQSSHNDFPWRGLKSSIPYSVDSHTTASAAVQLNMVHLPRMTSPPLAGLAGAVDKR